MTRIRQAKNTAQELTVEFMDIERLFLDDENPRLSSFPGKHSQADLVRLLWEEMAVNEVALSIAANGYFQEEPLFVIPKRPAPPHADKQEYVVVEGNRRLAAVMLLRDAALRHEVRATELPDLPEAERAKLARLPVSIHPDRKSLWAYFGFRHVNGPKEWDSFSKASYIAIVRRQHKIPLKEIARCIGDQFNTVERIYRGYLLLEQAETKTEFRREDRVANRFYFSHLYTAAAQKEFQSFLGIDPESSLEDNPVPKSHLPQLAEIMIWLFGSKDAGKSPVVESQSPHLGWLRKVLGNRQALFALRSGVSLQRAHEISMGDSRRFQEALARAKDYLQEAKATVTTGYKGERDLIGIVQDVQELANSIASEMRAKSKP